eukprot:513984-Prymnesium_polylepis.2
MAICRGEGARTSGEHEDGLRRAACGTYLRCAGDELKLHLEHGVRELRHLVERLQRLRSLPLVGGARLERHAQLRVERAAHGRVARALEGSAHVVRAHRRPQLLGRDDRLHLGHQSHRLAHVALEAARAQ